ncbi:hypothetical protein ACWDSF_06250 [Nocardia beijingensis]
MVIFRLRLRAARLARFLHLPGLADRIRPKVTPWYEIEPIPYREMFATDEPAVELPDWISADLFEDVLLAQAAYREQMRAEAKRAAAQARNAP